MIHIILDTWMHFLDRRVCRWIDFMHSKFGQPDVSQQVGQGRKRAPLLPHQHMQWIVAVDLAVVSGCVWLAHWVAS